MKVLIARILDTTVLLGVAFAAQPGHNASAGPGQSAGTQLAGDMNMTGMMTPVRSEREFIRGMVAHHQEAVDSARVVFKNTERRELRGFAAGVVEVQEREIGTLRGWLEAWYPNAPKNVPYTPMMRAALPDATPDESDRAFLEDMVVHHEMAVDMSKRFLTGNFEKRPETEALAQEIIDVQTDEVETLRGWLRSWYNAALPAGNGHNGN